MFEDLRYSLRVLARSPSFTLVAVLGLALGIGANSAIFTAMNAVLLRPLPYKQAEQLVLLWQLNRHNGDHEIKASAPDYLDLKEQNSVFQDIAAFNANSGLGLNLSGADQSGADQNGVSHPARISATSVTGNLFSVLGVTPALGRSFLPDEERPGSAPVCILSHDLWRRRFGSDPKIIGKTVTLNSEVWTVVGVMPAGFRFPQSVDLWVPAMVRSTARTKRAQHYLGVIARLKPGLSLDHAQAELNSLARRMELQYPETNAGLGITLVPLRTQITGNIRPALLVLFGATAFVLLIACTNLANLLLVRATVRQAEMSLRLALGASRTRLVRQLLTESALLGVLGGVLGLILAFAGTRLLLNHSPSNLPRTNEIAVDGRVLAFTLGLSVFTAVIFGMVPALQASKPDLIRTLKVGGSGFAMGHGWQRLRLLLVASEMALALVLLIGASLMIRSSFRLQEVNIGLDPRNVLTMDTTLTVDRYPAPRQIAFYRSVVERIGALPGVTSVGAVDNLPLGGSDVHSFGIEGRSAWDPGNEPSGEFGVVTPQYFNAIGIPLAKGRYFTEGDGDETPRVAIINEAVASRYWPQEDPLGKKITIDFEREPREIVGVVGNVRHLGIDQQEPMQVYIPHSQRGGAAMYLVVRATSDPLNLVPSIRAAVEAVDHDQPVYDIQTMEQRLSDSVSPRRFNMLLLGIFAAIALLLAGGGTYGVMSYFVTQQTHDIGIRMAMGADQVKVLTLVVGKGLVILFSALTIGIAVALAFSRVMSGLLFGISTLDLPSILGASLLLTTVGLLACYIPARRASRVDPVVALRCE
ncbi:MAG: ABC transporter permease [Candidatus Sulfotelmatobacter sp.]